MIIKQTYKVASAVYNRIKRREAKMKHNVPTMAGVLESTPIQEQLHINGESKNTEQLDKKKKTKPGRPFNPYAISNIGKRIWNPITQQHVDHQEFYRLLREEDIDLSKLRVNSHIDMSNTKGQYKFDGDMTEKEFFNYYSIYNSEEEPSILSVETSKTPQDKDQLYNVCVKQAIEIESKSKELNRLQSEINNLRHTIQEIQFQAVESHKKTGSLVRNIEKVIQEEECPF